MRLSDFSVQATQEPSFYLLTLRRTAVTYRLMLTVSGAHLTLKLVDGNRSQLRKVALGRMMQVQRALNLKSCLKQKLAL
ncbi:hypothetical protein ACRWGD_26035, partial [Escherichia coli]